MLRAVAISNENAMKRSIFELSVRCVGCAMLRENGFIISQTIIHFLYTG